MDIAQYISDLLNEHQEVSLQGIGTFYAKSATATLNNGLYNPPSHNIAFKFEDLPSTLLIQHIIAVKNISESSAIYFIERFCENLLSSLKNEKTASIAPLGTLVSANDTFIFEPSIERANPAFYGLSNVEEMPAIPKTLKKNVAFPAHTESVEEINEDEQEESKSGSKGLWITLFILLLIAGAVGFSYFYYPQYFPNINNQKEVKPKPKVVAPIIKQDSLKDSVSFADSIVNELERQGMHGTQVEKTPDSVSISSTSTKPDSLKVVFKPSKTFEIIVASFGLKNEALRAVRIYKNRGIEARVIVDNKKPKFKVSLGSFPTSAAAHKENRRVKQEVNAEAWVLTLKSN